MDAIGESPNRATLTRLLSRRLGKAGSYDEFRIAFEEFFTFHLKREQYSSRELAALRELFDVVVWYSPYTRERSQIRHYKNEHEVDDAVARARAAFRISEKEGGVENPKALGD